MARRRRHALAPLLLLLLLAASPASAFPSCTVSPSSTCYSDAPVRAVTYLVSQNDTHMTLESCAQLCAINGFTVLAATAHATPYDAAFCYCGLAVSPGAQPAPSANCSVPCPGDPTEVCGGLGVSSVHTLTCNGPLPPAPVGPPLAPGRACSQPEAQGWLFCNASAPLEDRVADLVGRVALPEIGPQLTARESPPIPRLGIPAFYWGTNAIHGIAGSDCVNGTCPSSWPDGVAMAASWNATAWRQMGATTGRELRALDNSIWSLQTAPAGGLTSWGPTINLLRDTRWGRSQESASEDPFMAGVYGASVSAGIQSGSDPRYLLAVATLKHFIAYSLEQYTDAFNVTWMRQTFDAVISDFDFADSYALPFQRAIQVGGAAGVMYAANEVNGVPCAGSAALDAVLHSWSFDGYRCTDGGQIINMVVGHHFVPTLDQAIGYAAVAESDIADGSEYETDLVHAVVNGNTTLQLAQRLLANIMRIRFRLGNFDPPAGQPYLDYTVANDMNTEEDKRAVSLASREGLVLLKNGNNGNGNGVGGPLPLSPAVHKNLAVIGPNANSTKTLQGNYGGAYCPNGPHGPVTDCYPTIFTALAAYAPQSVYVQGSGIDVPIDGGLQQAAAAVAQADAAVLVIGLDQTQEAEQLDRFYMTLPQAQQDLYAAVQAAAAAAKVPLVVVLVHGGALAIPEVAASADAILDAFYPGVTGGPAVADALYGVYVPGGKLPYTHYLPSYQWAYNFTSMAVANGTAASSDNGTVTGGRTYRYFSGPVLYPFGYGLSYANFSLGWGAGAPVPAPTVQLSLSQPSTTVPLSVRVSCSAFAGGPSVSAADEVVQAYFVPTPGTFGDPAPPFLPLRSLFAFQRAHVTGCGTAAGYVDLAFSVGPLDLQVTGADNVRRPREGSFTVVLSRGPGADGKWQGDELTFGVVVGA